MQKLFLDQFEKMAATSHFSVCYFSVARPQISRLQIVSYRTTVKCTKSYLNTVIKHAGVSPILLLSISKIWLVLIRYIVIIIYRNLSGLLG
jgi:hypothetical protein